MKKLKCLFIAALFVLTACTTGGDESVSDISGTVSEDDVVQGIAYTLTKESIEKMLSDRTSAIKAKRTETASVSTLQKPRIIPYPPAVTKSSPTRDIFLPTAISEIPTTSL